jgi:hypothetical protein
MQRASDADEYFAEVPRVSWLVAGAGAASGEVGTELQALMPDALVDNQDAPFG